MDKDCQRCKEKMISFLLPTVDGSNPAPVDRWLIPSFLGFQVSTIQGGAGFLPPTVCITYVLHCVIHLHMSNLGSSSGRLTSLGGGAYGVPASKFCPQKVCTGPRTWPNLLEVADWFQSRFPGQKVRFCHQLDHATSGVGQLSCSQGWVKSFQRSALGNLLETARF